MLETLNEIVRRIKDELLLWLIAMLLIAIVAGIRDKITSIVVLVVGASLIALRLVLGQREHGLPLTITFAGRQIGEVQLHRCRFELRSQENVVKSQGELAFSFDLDSWVCFLPRAIAATDILRLYLTDQQGQLWETGPFRPLFGSREARKSP